MVGKKKIIRRRRSKNGASRTPYFGKDAQDAIEQHQKSVDPIEKEMLFLKKILPAFDKLVENLIFIHGFAKMHDSYEDLKSDCVAFLFESMHKWDPSRGTKAFSYFNVVAKNWLIIQSKKKMNNVKRNVSIADISILSSTDKEKIENYKIVPAQDTVMIHRDSIKNIHKLLHEIKTRLKSKNELLCIDSIITIFENVDNIDLLNKRAVFLYIREMSGLTPKQLTMTMSTIKKHYRELKGKDEFEIF